MRVRDARQTFIDDWTSQLLDSQAIEILGGEQLLDFNDIDDEVEALLLAGSLDELASTPSHLGSPERLNLRQLDERMIRLHGSGDIRLMSFPAERKKIDIGDYYSCYDRFQRDAGWQPSRSLEQTLERTIAYYHQHQSHYL